MSNSSEELFTGNQKVQESREDSAQIVQSENALVAGGSALADSQSEVAHLNRRISEQTRYFEAIHASVSDFAYTFDKNGRFLFINQALLDLWGLKLEEAVGKNFFDLNYPPYLAVKLAQQIQEVFENRQRVKGETSYTSPTGIIGYYEYIFSPVFDADDLVEIVAGTTRDLTIHHQTEQHLRLLQALSQGTINALTGHIAVLDDNFIIVEVNKAWRKFAEENLFQGTNYGIGQSYLEACVSSKRTALPDGIAAAEGIRQVASGAAETFELEYPCHSPTERRWFMMRVTRFNESGNTLRLVVAHENISDRKLAEAALQEANQKLYEANRQLNEASRRKDEFLATLAHELRNPLAPIRSGLEVIRRLNKVDEKLSETLDIIERQTNQMVHLVDDLLDIARITQGKIRLKKERLELQTAISMAIETSRELIDKSKNELTVILPDKPIYINADLTRIAQIFLNILNNAAKYSDPGGKILLTVKKDDGEVVISIKDTGLGIEPEMLARIFDMFGQIEIPDEQARGGLGIGLSVVKKLTEMHEGTVEVLSEGIGKGSEFIVCLPLAAESSESTPASLISEAGILQTAQLKMPENAEDANFQTDEKNYRILIVDDNVDAVEMMKTLLSFDGHHICTAFDGQTGIVIAQDFQPEICLLDIGLPGMNGYELAGQLRKFLPQSLLISISGWGQPEDRQRSVEAGFDYHLVKPVDFDDLLKLINRRPD